MLAHFSVGPHRPSVGFVFGRLGNNSRDPHIEVPLHMPFGVSGRILRSGHDHAKHVIRLFWCCFTSHQYFEASCTSCSIVCVPGHAFQMARDVWILRGGAPAFSICQIVILQAGVFGHVDLGHRRAGNAIPRTILSSMTTLRARFVKRNSRIEMNQRRQNQGTLLRFWLRGTWAATAGQGTASRLTHSAWCTRAGLGLTGMWAGCWILPLLYSASRAGAEESAAGVSFPHWFGRGPRMPGSHSPCTS